MPYWKQTNVVDEYGVKIDTNADTDGRYHSNWMNMMFSRLLVARQLLRKDGVIFISIDDNEVHNLRRLCNEVFGPENLVGVITVLCNPKGRSQDKYFATNHENVIVYSKNLLPKGSFSVEKDEEQIAKEYSEEDEIGKYRLLELRNTHREFGKHNRKNLYYPLYIDEESGEVSINKSDEAIEVLPIWDDDFKGCWTWDKNKALNDNDYLVGVKNREGNWKVYRKSYANGADKMYKSIFLDKSFYTEKGPKEFNKLFETKSKVFQSPKSVELLKSLIRTSADEESIVLDFFAGSGTTGQAVMELNEADGGNRKFILVQLPELTDEESEACKAGYKRISDITIERNKRVVERIIAEKRAKHPNLFDQIGNAHESNIRTAHEVSVSDSVEKSGKDAYFVRGSDLRGLGFKVFKLEKSYFPRTEWTPNPEAGEAENVQSLKDYIAAKESQLRIDFDRDKLLIEILLKEGFKLNYKVKPFKIRTAHEVSVLNDKEPALNDKKPAYSVRGSDENEILHVTDADKEALVCLDNTIATETVEYFKTHKDLKFICLERGLDTTKKWNLANSLGEKFKAV